MKRSNKILMYLYVLVQGTSCFSSEDKIETTMGLGAHSSHEYVQSRFQLQYLEASMLLEQRSQLGLGVAEVLEGMAAVNEAMAKLRRLMVGLIHIGKIKKLKSELADQLDLRNKIYTEMLNEIEELRGQNIKSDQYRLLLSRNYYNVNECKQTIINECEKIEFLKAASIQIVSRELDAMVLMLCIHQENILLSLDSSC